MSYKNKSEVQMKALYTELQMSRLERSETMRRVRLRKPKVAHVIPTPEGGCLVINVHRDDGQPEHWFFDHQDEDCESIEVRDGYFSEGECMSGAIRYLFDRQKLVNFAPEMHDQLAFLVEHCIEVDERQYADGSPYMVEFIHDGSSVPRIRKLLEKMKA